MISDEKVELFAEMLKDMCSKNDKKELFCSGTKKTISRAIFAKLNCNEYDIEKIFKKFEKHDGYCDCEIMLNVFTPSDKEHSDLCVHHTEDSDGKTIVATINKLITYCRCCHKKYHKK